ncbi:MAG: hypothetical protein JWP04_2260 [Belnapia sp.]|nr:hypothetical protein [Belnapia sp.]
MPIHRRSIGIVSGAAVLMAAAAGYNPVQAQAAAEQAVAQAVEALTKAMIEVDRGRLEALTADGLSYGHSAGRIETKKQFVDYLESKASAFRTINLSDQTISVVGSDAIVRHLFTGETVSPAGQVTPVRIGVLQVWQKQGNDWRLLARQAYRL